MLDNRAHPRIPTRLSGRLLSRDGRCNMSCTLKDVSEGGACVSAMDLGVVPRHLYLYVEKSGDMFECEVRWRRADEMGLRFIDFPGPNDRHALLRLCALSPVGS
jgi:PilZ domain